MKYRSFIVLAAWVANSATACPSLPGNSEFEWVYKEGPDFGVCYATEKGSDRAAFGVYFGEHPAFREVPANKVGKGRVAGKDVTWYKQDQPNKDSPLGRETLIVINKRYGAVAHLWINAATEAELTNRLAAVEGIVFED